MSREEMISVFGAGLGADITMKPRALCSCGHVQSPPERAVFIRGALYCAACADEASHLNHDDDGLEEPF